MIYDCFLFNNELDLLEIRLNELSPVVDKFVLVESTVSHTNKPKPLYFKKNKKRYSKFLDKITHIVVDDTPNVSLAWIINDYQFTQISRGLKDCKKDDIIIFGDVDEIPKAKRIVEYSKKRGNLKIFDQKLAFFYLNFFEYKKNQWLGTRMTSYSYFESLKTPWIAKFSYYDTIIPDGGWHFSYLGDVKMIQNKLASMAHQEFNNENYNTREKIELSILEGRDMFGLGYKFRKVDIKKLPEYVAKNPEKFQNRLLHEGKKSVMTQILLKKYLKLKHIFRVRFVRTIRNMI